MSEETARSDDDRPSAESGSVENGGSDPADPGKPARGAAGQRLNPRLTTLRRGVRRPDARQRLGSIAEQMQNLSREFSGKELSSNERTTLGVTIGSVALIALVGIFAGIGGMFADDNDRDDREVRSVQSLEEDAEETPERTPFATQPVVCPPDEAQIAQMEEEAENATAIRRTVLRGVIARMYEDCGMSPPGTPEMTEDTDDSEPTEAAEDD